MTVPPLPRTVRRFATPRTPRLALAALAVLGALTTTGGEAVAQTQTQTLSLPRPDPAADAARFHANLEATRFHARLDADWQFQMQEHPEWATSLGDHRYDDRLDDESPEAIARRDTHARDQLKALRKLDRAALSGEDLISYDVALLDAQLAVDFQHYPAMHTRVLSAMGGVQIDLPALMRDMPVRNEADARHALARLKAMPVRIAQDIALAREGKRLGWVTFKSSLGKVPDQIDGLMSTPMPDNPLVDPFKRLPADMPDDVKKALQDEAIATLRDQVLPAFLDLRKAIVEDLLPASPDDGALSSYPDGAAVYKLFIRKETTLDTDAQTVHDLGLSEVARLHGRIADVMKEVGFSGSYAEFVYSAYHDPKFFYSTPEQLLTGYRDIAKRVDPALTRLFLVLPRTPYGVRAIPAWQGANAPAFYTSGAVDGSSPGWFNANVAAIAQRPSWGMTDLFLHEAVPGHHLQVSRAHELTQLPIFRRVAEYTAYVEGWALYAEGLGTELGVYGDPYVRFGQLQGEIFRAGRLVVDTGIHALGWTRAQAIAYLVDETGETPDDAAAEVDRHYVMPAQALSYKLGQMKILALRQKARAALGDRFDVRAFHQEVLDHGALPLPVLDQVISAWIERVKSARVVPSAALISSRAPD